MKIVLLLFFILLNQVSSQNIPESPCPDVFRYENDNYGWYGVITAMDPPYQRMIRIEVNLSVARRLPNSYVGSIEIFNNMQSVSREISQGYPIMYKVNFPIQEPIPNLVNIIFADRMICSGPPAYGSFVTSLKLQFTLTVSLYDNNRFPLNAYRPNSIDYERNEEIYTPNRIINNFVRRTTITTAKTTSDLPTTTIKTTTDLPTTTVKTTTALPASSVAPNSDYKYYKCGEFGSIGIRIHLGNEITKGEYPWLVALFMIKQNGVGNVNIEFRCGSSLISEKLVVTAAHCVTKYNKTTINPNDLLLKLGVYDLEDLFDELIVNRKVKQIHIPEDYDRTTNFNDIAVLMMTQTVTFSSFIRPVCLWEDDTEQSRVFGLEGKVVGWGKDEKSQTVTPRPKEVDVPIVSTSTCRASHVNFFKYTTNNTLCGGSRDGSGPCSGDSGGGLYIQQNGKWILRGITSQSLRAENSCDLNEYVIYTDCAKYIDWISSIY